MDDQHQDKIKQEEFEAHYRAKTTPWDLGRADFNLTDTVTKQPIESCRALDIGCGTGHNSIWLAQQGFQVTGVDVSETALQKAKENASKAKAECTFLSAVFLAHEIPGAPFGFIFDRGCWHLLDDRGREKFAEKAAYYLEEGGLWLSIIGSADEPPRGPGPLAGPPRHSAYDITVAVEPYFEILLLSASHFDSNHPKPPKAWACLMKKRSKSAGNSR
jgi:SAM-dependent methyltransferase